VGQVMSPLFSLGHPAGAPSVPNCPVDILSLFLDVYTRIEGLDRHFRLHSQCLNHRD
jgi:hypothetical protein